MLSCLILVPHLFRSIIFVDRKLGRLNKGSSAAAALGTARQPPGTGGPHCPGLLAPCRHHPQQTPFPLFQTAELTLPSPACRCGHRRHTVTPSAHAWVAVGPVCRRGSAEHPLVCAGEAGELTLLVQLRTRQRFSASHLHGSCIISGPSTCGSGGCWREAALTLPCLSLPPALFCKGRQIAQEGFRVGSSEDAV